MNPLKPIAGTDLAAYTSARAEAYKTIDGVMIPCSWEEYIAWMNANTTRPGEYVTVLVNGRRTLDWRAQAGSDGWLRDRGITPPADRRAKAKSEEIGHYVTDYGRAA